MRAPKNTHKEMSTQERHDLKIKTIEQENKKFLSFVREHEEEVAMQWMIDYMHQPTTDELEGLMSIVKTLAQEYKEPLPDTITLNTWLEIINMI